jgi:Ser/Thr protein kinase RdoA (MazF antagonist)
MVVLVQSVDAPGGKAVLKGLRAGRFRAALERQLEGSRAGRAAGLSVPEVIATDPGHAAFMLSWMGEATVPLAVGSARLFARLGAALARFQCAEGGAELELHGVDDELTVLEELSARSARLRGALPQDWAQARDRVASHVRSIPPGPAVRTHRDLHDGQLLDVAGDVALLDFDLLCRADEALDPSNLLAHLELRQLQGLADSAGALACAQAFRVGYGREGEAELAQRMRAWQAVSLLRLALVYHLRPPYAHLSQALVERALTHLLEA